MIITTDTFVFMLGVIFGAGCVLLSIWIMKKMTETRR